MEDNSQQGVILKPPAEQLISGQPEEHALDGPIPEASDQTTSQPPELHVPIDQAVEPEGPAESGQLETSGQADSPSTSESLSEADALDTYPKDHVEANVPADAESKFRDMAANMEKSGDFRTVEAARLVREHGAEIAEQAAEKYREREKAYTNALAHLVSELAAIQSGGIEITPDRGYVLVGELDGQDRSIGKEGLTSEQRKELRQAVYDAYGFKAPADSELELVGSKILHDTNLGDGLYLRDEIWLKEDKTPSGFETSIIREE